MASKKASRKPEKVAATVAATAQVKTTAEQEHQEKTIVDLVICAFAGTEELMLKLWKRSIGDHPFKVFTVGQDIAPDVNAVAAELLADESVAEDFVLVPANTFPTKKISFSELQSNLVYVRKNGNKEYAHRLPMPMSKTAIVSILSEKEFMTAEQFCQEMTLSSGSMPVEVGHTFGNYVCYVLRPDPCENVVIGALIQKKFISTNVSGWEAITGLVNKLVAE